MYVYNYVVAPVTAEGKGHVDKQSNLNMHSDFFLLQIVSANVTTSVMLRTRCGTNTNTSSKRKN